MNEEDILKLIAQDEGQYIEFKVERETPKDLAEVLQGFCHAEGGTLLIGVSDTGEIIGVKRPKSVLDNLNRAATMLTPSLLPYLDIQVVSVHNKHLIIVQVPQVTDQIFILAGGYHKRQGSFTIDMLPDEIMERMTNVGRVSVERMAVSDSTLSDIDTERFHKYLVRRSDTPEGSGDLRDLLQRTKFLAHDGFVERPTFAAMLLFGRNPQRFAPLFNARILAARFSGTIPVEFIDEANIAGTIADMVDEALKFCKRNTHTRVIIDPALTGSAEALRVNEYPEPAIREALVNAVCHRNYYTPIPVYLKIFDDRIEIQNPGGLYKFKTIDEAKGQHESRNPLISETLHTLGIIERFGTGLYRIERLLTQWQLPKPGYMYNTDRFQITLYGPEARGNSGETSDHHQYPDLTKINAPASEERELEFLTNLAGAQPLATRKRQAQIMAYLRKSNKVISTNEYATITKIGITIARVEINELVRLGVLERQGNYKSTTYTLAPSKASS